MELFESEKKHGMALILDETDDSCIAVNICSVDLTPRIALSQIWPADKILTTFSLKERLLDLAWNIIFS